MTITEFVNFLDAGGDWSLDPDGNIQDDNDDCPLWHAYHRGFDTTDVSPEDYVEAGRRCGLRTRDAVAIAQAADKRGHPRLRKRLLARLGLEEKR